MYAILVMDMNDFPLEHRDVLVCSVLEVIEPHEVS